MGIEIGLAERLAARAVAGAVGLPGEQVLASAREVGDLGLAAETLLAATAAERPATLEVGVVFDTLHEIAALEGQGSQGGKLDLLTGLIAQATPLEARYLVRTVTGSLRLGIGTATILDALAAVHGGGRASRPVLERAYNICCDLGLVASTLAAGGLAAVEEIRTGPPHRRRRDRAVHPPAGAHRHPVPRPGGAAQDRHQAARGDPGGRGRRLRPGLRGPAPLPGR